MRFHIGGQQILHLCQLSGHVDGEAVDWQKTSENPELAAFSSRRCQPQTSERQPYTNQTPHPTHEDKLSPCKRICKLFAIRGGCEAVILTMTPADGGHNAKFRCPNSRPVYDEIKLRSSTRG